MEQFQSLLSNYEIYLKYTKTTCVVLEDQQKNSIYFDFGAKVQGN